MFKRVLEVSELYKEYMRGTERRWQSWRTIKFPSIVQIKKGTHRDIETASVQRWTHSFIDRAVRSSRSWMERDNISYDIKMYKNRIASRDRARMDVAETMLMGRRRKRIRRLRDIKWE